MKYQSCEILIIQKGQNTTHASSSSSLQTEYRNSLHKVRTGAEFVTD